MSDSSRPVAPYLPPEIIERILDFVHPGFNWFKSSEIARNLVEVDYARLSRISSDWKFSAQKRLFSFIEIRGPSSTVEKLFENSESLLTRFCTSFWFTTDPDYFLLLEQRFRCPNLFPILQILPNLKSLFVWTEHRLVIEESQIQLIKSTVSLPNLKKLALQLVVLDDDILCDLLVAAAPNLQTLDISGVTTGRDFFQSYQRPPFTSSLSNLKELSGCKAVIEGHLWPIESFKGLEKLRVGTARSISEKSLRFWETVGPSLKELETGLIIPTFASTHLIALRLLTIYAVRDEQWLCSFPPSITHLRIQAVSRSQGLLFSAGWTHLINLEVLEIGYWKSDIDTSLLPVLKCLSIKVAERKNVVEWLENMKEVRFEELVLGTIVRSKNSIAKSSIPVDSIINERIEELCQKLGIKLTNYVE